MSFIIDQAHTQIGFAVKHMMVSTVRGQFRQYRGSVQIDPADFTQSRFEGEVDVASIDTGNAQRDDHLRTSDFFDAPNHPQITFRSSRVEPRSESEFVVHGDLTIRGVTKPIALDVEFHGTSKNPLGKTVAGLTARSTINRRDFGVSYNAILEAGGVAVGEKVKLEIEAEFTAAEVTASAAAE